MVSAGCLLGLHWRPSPRPHLGGGEEPGRALGVGGTAVSRLGGVTVVPRCSRQVAWRR